MKNRPSFWIYLAGLLPLAIWAPSARMLLGDWLSFAAVIAYLLVLRLISALAARLPELRRQKVIAEHNRSVEVRKREKR